MSVRPALLLVLSALVASAASPAVGHASHCSTLQTTLSGPAIAGVVPTGRGDWKGTPTCTGVELKVEVRNVNLPDGTVLTLDTCGIQRSLTLRSREVRFEVKQSAPTCTVGQPVTVRRGDATVVSGNVVQPALLALRLT